MNVKAAKISTAKGIFQIKKYLSGPVYDATLGVHVITMQGYVGYFAGISAADYIVKHGAKLLDYCGHTITVEV
jgi:hypothetical protein